MNFIHMRCLIILILSLAASMPLFGQQTNYEKYINKYDRYAVDQMKRYGIPASITLAQGLLESAAGTSRLATKGNNHFGIKVGGDWRGPYMLMDDDYPNEKFRVYRSAKDSYEDHSIFLYGRERYAALFNLSSKDYKGWARGLKKAGYATNPRYADNLISLIERYDLTKYDGKKRKLSRKERKRILLTYPIYMCNKKYYTIAKEGDTYADLSEIFRKSEKRLRKYNEVDDNYELSGGEVVYLEEKSSKADDYWKGHFHKIEPGESLYSISQRFGVKMRTLYKINYLKPDQNITIGDLLLIR